MVGKKEAAMLTAAGCGMLLAAACAASLIVAALERWPQQMFWGGVVFWTLITAAVAVLMFECGRRFERSYGLTESGPGAAPDVRQVPSAYPGYVALSAVGKVYACQEDLVLSACVRNGIRMSEHPTLGPVIRLEQLDVLTASLEGVK